MHYNNAKSGQKIAFFRKIPVLIKKRKILIRQKKRLIQSNKPLVSYICCYNGVAEIRTLAPVSRPTPLARAPLQPLEYYSKSCILILANFSGSVKPFYQIFSAFSFFCVLFPPKSTISAKRLKRNVIFYCFWLFSFIFLKK